MPDPFEALRTALTPIEPDAAFAARLRARVVRALVPPDQGEPSMTLSSAETTERVRQGDVTYLSLWLPDIDRAARFYADVLGWAYAPGEVSGSRLIEGQSIVLGLSELEGAGKFLSSLGVPLPRALTPTGYPVFVVDQLEGAIERVRAAGGWAGEPITQPYGRVAACVDDQGLVFSLQEVPAGMPAPRASANGARQGDPAYLTFEFPDATRARDFYATVLGMRFQPGRSADGWNVPDLVPMAGFAGGAARPTVVPMFRVDDIRTAVERIRAAGGTATEPSAQPYGITADCVDNQGLRFYLGQL